MRTIAFVHQKGGTGKTTLAIATAMALAEAGARVLLLDTDVQGTAGEWGSRWGDRFRVVAEPLPLAAETQPVPSALEEGQAPRVVSQRETATPDASPASEQVQYEPSSTRESMEAEADAASSAEAAPATETDPAVPPQQSAPEVRQDSPAPSIPEESASREQSESLPGEPVQSARGGVETSHATGTFLPLVHTEGQVAHALAPSREKIDYGWLMQALWIRVAELKRYPTAARLNRWQGQVIVRAVIDEHRHLLDVAVAESSGHGVLDRAAIDVIKQSCPLELTQPLGRHQIVVRVPIHYRLDS